MLLDILTEVAQELGRSTSDLNERRLMIAQINHAAKEIYETDDILGCEREQVFNIGLSDQQITLPSYVGEILGARNYDSRSNIQQVDMRPRYARSGWKKPFQQWPYLQWRKKGNTPVCRSIVDEAAITVSLPDGVVAERDFTVSITGSNEQSSRVVDVLTFSSGDTTKTTSKFFGDIESITKNKAIDYDLTVTDVNGDTIAQIPNTQLNSNYLLIQVLDRLETNNPAALVEVLYKPRFRPMQLDTDVFTAGEAYDKVIFWKTMAFFYAKMDGKEDRVQMFDMKSQSLLSNLIASAAGNIEMEIDFGRNGTLEAFRYAEYDSAVRSPQDVRLPGSCFTLGS
jgi:hypothetical protein